jgi:hypothetical protein
MAKELWFQISKAESVQKAMIQRSQIQSNPTKSNPNETPDKKNKKFFSFVF